MIILCFIIDITIGVGTTCTRHGGLRKHTVDASWNKTKNNNDDSSDNTIIITAAVEVENFVSPETKKVSY